MKELSIVIINYNTSDYVSGLLNSLSTSSDKLPDNWEVVIVDNASTEKVTIPHDNRLVRLIHNPMNVGFARANNQAIKASTGKYVLLLNPDTIVSRDALSSMVSFLKHHEKAGVATCRIELPDGSLDDASHRGFPTPWRAFCYFSGLSKLFPQSMWFNGYHLGYQQMDRPHEIESCVGAFMMAKRDVGNEVGWLDEDFFWYGEDIDFCYRVKEKGWQVWYVPNVSIVHYKGISSGIKKHSVSISTASKETKRKSQKARFEAMELFYQKHYRRNYSWIVNQLVRFGIRVGKTIVSL